MTQMKCRDMIRAGFEAAYCARRIAAAAVASLLVILALAGSSWAAGKKPADKSPGAPIVEGRHLFETKGCARCHSVWGTEGKRKVGPDLGGAGSAWRDMMWFAGALWNHSPEMNKKMRELKIERAPITPEEARKIAAYLFYVKFLGRPGNAERGRKFFDRFSCSRCHQFGGHGGTVGPRLDELKDYMSVHFLARALWNHGPKMAETMERLKITRPYLEGDDVRDLVAYLRGGSLKFSPLEQAYSQAGIPRAGETLFREKGCIGCHAVGEKGGVTAPNLGKQRLSLDLAQIAAALWDHGPSMWAAMKAMGVPFPELSAREVSDLLAYLAYIQYLGPRGDPGKGAALFRKKLCARCHAVGDKGPKVGPDLALSSASASTLHWVSAIWNHGLAMEKKLGEQELEWPRFEDEQMRDLVEFIRSRKKNNLKPTL